MPFAAFDLHKQDVEAVILNDDGTVRLRHRFPTTRAALVEIRPTTPRPRHRRRRRSHLQHLARRRPPHPPRQGSRRQQPAAHPRHRRSQNQDRQSRCPRPGPTPAPRLPAPRLDSRSATRHQRRATTERTQLTSDRTRLKNRIHAILHQRLIEAPTGDLFTPANLAWLRALPSIPSAAPSWIAYLRLSINCRTRTDCHQLSRSLRDAHAPPEVKLLMTLPASTSPWPRPSSPRSAISRAFLRRPRRRLSRPGAFHAPIRRALLPRPHHQARLRSRALDAGPGRPAPRREPRAARRLLPPHCQAQEVATSPSSPPRAS